MDINKIICIHGHFYQPPRENAWLDNILIQRSAAPFHNWNERITLECYGPNTVARILNEKDEIIGLNNNFTDISFNIGPTLLSWLEKYNPKIYQRILKADMQSILQTGSNGGAMAQVYNHLIMPLAKRRDKQIQIKWGIVDFEKRFGRKPEGMWLAETAIDIETLEIMAECGITYTILSSHQAKQYRKLNEVEWHQTIDSRYPYVCKLPNNKEIILFFYNAALSQALAFGDLLDDGKKMASAIVDCFDTQNSEPQIVHTAVDGETFGHHHKYGEMALAYCLETIKKDNTCTLGNYSLFLKHHPVLREVQINENTSWSCAHGIERWRSDCGCKTGGADEWNQQWRLPLRKALDILKNKLDTIYDQEIRKKGFDPQELIEKYIHIILDRTPENVIANLNTFFEKTLSDQEITTYLRLLEIQRQSQLMFTSCAWFFNDLEGIETTQVLQYAARAIQLAEVLTGANLEIEFINDLKLAKSNDPDSGDGAAIYYEKVLSQKLNMEMVGMHFATYHIILGKLPQFILNYHYRNNTLQTIERNHHVLHYGEVEVLSSITLAHEKIQLAIMYSGNFNICGAVSNQILYENKYFSKLVTSFENMDFKSCEDMLRSGSLGKPFSFKDILYDERGIIIEKELKKSLQSSKFNLGQDKYQSMKMLKELNHNLPVNHRKKIENQLFQLMEQYLQKPWTISNSVDLMAVLAEMNYWEIKIKQEEMAIAFEKYLDNFPPMSQLESIEIFNEHCEAAYDLIRSIHSFNIHPAFFELRNTVFTSAKMIYDAQQEVPQSLQNLLSALNIKLV